MSTTEDHHIYLENEYSKNWKSIGTLLIYKSDNFQFKSSVIITDLDDCIIPYISAKKIYDKYNKYDITIHTDLITQLKKENSDKSIIVLTNQDNTSKLNIDMIKRKVETFIEKTQIPILIFCALKNNKFAKPHTGMWKLLNVYYKKYGSCSICNSLVISDEGGLITEKTTKKGIYSSKINVTDIDRAFANNINSKYNTIDEYLGLVDKKPFRWNMNIISPEVRELYCDEIERYMKERNNNILDLKNLYNNFIFKELAQFNIEEFINDTFAIIILGPPRGGKTTVAKNIVTKWKNSNFGNTHAIELLSQNDMTNRKRLNQYTKLLDDRISVIIDGDCHISNVQNQYVRIAHERKIPILFIEVNPGIEMAKVLNHAAVEDAGDENTILYKDDVFNIYKSLYKRPTFDNIKSRYIMYCPIINKKNSIMQYRY
jgi:bifunctional polynucleotide phosphatase/kinase